MVNRSWLWMVMVLAACLVLRGCGSAERKAQLEQAQQAVTIGLDAWKSGEKADALLARSPPIEFHDDDWQKSARLVSYEIALTYHDTDGLPRCAAVLTVERASGQQAEVKVTYQIVTEPKVIIARDPMS